MSKDVGVLFIPVYRLVKIVKPGWATAKFNY